MHEWPRDERRLLIAAFVVFMVGILAAGLRAELGPVSDWACAWRVRNGDVVAPDVRGMRLGDARRHLHEQHACVDLRVVGAPAANSPAPTVRHQSPAPGDTLDQRRIDVIVESAAAT